MKNRVQKANEEIVKTLASGELAVLSKIGNYIIVTLPPFHMAHILTEDQVFFALNKAKYNETLGGKFSGLLDLAETTAEENRIKPTGAYYSTDGKTFLEEFGRGDHEVWLNTKYTKDLGPMCVQYYQESDDKIKGKGSSSPVLATVSGRPARIILPTLKLWKTRDEKE